MVDFNREHVHPVAPVGGYLENETKDRKPSLSDRIGGWVDNLCYMVSPRWGNRRTFARRLRAIADKRFEKLEHGWKGAETDRQRGARWMTSRLSADSQLELDLTTLRERCEGLYRTNSIIHSAVEGRVSNEVGIGIMPQARVAPIEGRLSKEQAQSINERLEALYQETSIAGMDRTRAHSMETLQRLACRIFAASGEVFVLQGDQATAPGEIPLTIDIIDPSRVQTPENHSANPLVRMGIEYNADGPNGSRGSIKGYWVADAQQGDTKEFSTDYTFYPRINSLGHGRMLHIYDPIMAAQSRGLPWCASAMDRALDIDDYVEAEIATKQVESCFGVVVEGGESSPSPMDLAEGTASTKDSQGNRIEELSPAMVHYLGDGESVSTVDPSRPGSNFPGFIENGLRMIAGALNYPYELLAKNFFRTTFSSGRLSMLDGRQAFRMRRQILVQKFLIPLWQRFVFEAMMLSERFTAEELLLYRSNPKHFEKVMWQGQGWAFIDVEREVNANIKAVEADQATLHEVYADRGRDASEELEKRKMEKLQQVEDDIEVRKLQWDLEESNGLPHAEESAQGQDSGNSSSNSPVEIPTIEFSEGLTECAAL